MDKKNIFTFDPTDVYAIINGKKAPTKKKVAQIAPSRGRGRGRRTIARVNSDLSASDSDSDGGDRCR